jgi:hypothetical protein
MMMKMKMIRQISKSMSIPLDTLCEREKESQLIVSLVTSPLSERGERSKVLVGNINSDDY